MVEHTFNTSTLEAVAAGPLGVPGQPGLRRETPSQNKQSSRLPSAAQQVQGQPVTHQTLSVKKKKKKKRENNIVELTST